MTLFQKVASRDVAAEIVFETDEVIAFKDIHPQAPVHVLIVPKRLIPRVAEAGDADALLLGRLLLAAGSIARDLGLLPGGFRLVINNGPDAGESVPHLHVHLLGGRPLAWPPG